MQLDKEFRAFLQGQLKPGCALASALEILESDAADLAKRMLTFDLDDPEQLLKAKHCAARGKAQLEVLDALRALIMEPDDE